MWGDLGFNRNRGVCSGGVGRRRVSVAFAYLYGHVLTELQEVIERPEETDHVLRLGLHRLTITEFPQLRALASALATYDGAAELNRGLDLLLPGLASALPRVGG